MTLEFSHFDARRYPTVPVTEGYTGWAATYGDPVLDLMDLRLLAATDAVVWRGRRALDLACGTGRIGAWLRTQGVRSLDGVDLTPAMLERARDLAQAGRPVYDDLRLVSITDTGLATGFYDLVTQSLACEHLEDLDPLYAEVARVLRPGGQFAIVGFHPFFLLDGVPTHFDRAPGESVAIESWVHLFSDHFAAAHAAGLSLVDLREGLVDDAFVARKPKWEKYRHRPVTSLQVWRKPVESART